MKFLNKFFAIFVLLFCVTAFSAEEIEKEIIPDNINLDNLVLMELDNGGVVIIEMYPNKAPWHVYRMRLLIANNFYDGLSFFRAII